MNDVSVFLEHVDLLDRLDRLDVKFFERGLQLLVVGAGRLVDFLGLAARCAFASIVWSGVSAGTVVLKGKEPNSRFGFRLC